jgi:hypothetical protein
MVMSQQMQDAMHDQQLHFSFHGMTCGLRLLCGAGDRDEDVAQIGGSRFRVRFGGGEGKHIGWGIHAEVIAIQFVQLAVIRQDDGDVCVGMIRTQVQSEARRSFEQR